MEPWTGQRWWHRAEGIVDVYNASFRLNFVTLITELVIVDPFFLISNSKTHG